MTTEKKKKKNVFPFWESSNSMIVGGKLALIKTPCWLGYVVDFTTQFYRDCHKPI